MRLLQPSCPQDLVRFVSASRVAALICLPAHEGFHSYGSPKRRLPSCFALSDCTLTATLASVHWPLAGTQVIPSRTSKAEAPLHSSLSALTQAVFPASQDLTLAGEAPHEPSIARSYTSVFGSAALSRFLLSVQSRVALGRLPSFTADLQACLLDLCRACFAPYARLESPSLSFAEPVGSPPHAFPSVDLSAP